MNRPQRQKGATLAVALILLLVSTLIGVSSIQVTSMQEKMSSNTQDMVTAFEAAESALIAGEQWILSLSAHPVPIVKCQSFPCVQQQSTDAFPQDKNDAWWTSNSASYSGSLGNVSTAPRYYIEFLEFVPDSPAIGSAVIGGVYYYRVTARGTGNTSSATSILQTTFARRY